MTADAPGGPAICGQGRSRAQMRAARSRPVWLVPAPLFARYPFPSAKVIG